MNTLIIDNYDSFTFNLFQCLAAVNEREPIVVRHDDLTVDAVRSLHVDNIVISPGPGRPDCERDFGVCADVLRQLDIPTLGVCLGCQGLGSVFGATIARAPEPMHGRISTIHHNGSELFRSIPPAFRAVRYHSLIVVDELPDVLEKIAWTEDGLIMGLRHRTRPLWGVQFHPESIATEHGLDLLRNFRMLTQKVRARSVANPPPAPPALAMVPSRVPHRPYPVPAAPAFELHWRRLSHPPTPEDAFVHLFGQAKHAFWLDSSLLQPGLSRYSFMGALEDPTSVYLTGDAQAGTLCVTTGGESRTTTAGTLDYLRRELTHRRCSSRDLAFEFQGGFVGYLGYEMKAECGTSARHRSNVPDAAFLRVDRFLAFDPHEHAVFLVCVTPRGNVDEARAWLDAMEARVTAVPAAPPIAVSAALQPEVRLVRGRAEYEAAVDACRQRIDEGEASELCLTHNLHVAGPVDPLRLHRILRRRNPAPYAAFLRLGEIAVVSSSPERFLKIGLDRWVETKPIKGTAPRGATPQEDSQRKESLRRSEKNRAENLMIVDLMRNDLGVVCDIGSVHVPRLMDVETYATVHQMVSTVRGRLRGDVDAIDCIRHAFPAGSMTGAPKRRAMEILDGLEVEARGVYSGALGWIGYNGAADLSVVIRTAVVARGETTVGSGGAVVTQSNPADEFDETQLKARAVLEAVAQAKAG